MVFIKNIKKIDLRCLNRVHQQFLKLLIYSNWFLLKKKKKLDLRCLKNINCDVTKVNCTLSLNYGVSSPLKFIIKQCPHDNKQITPSLLFCISIKFKWAKKILPFFFYLKFGPIYKNVMYNSIYTHNKKKIIHINFLYKYKISRIKALN